MRVQPKRSFEARSTSARRCIQRRGREYEIGIRIDYLSKLNEKYDKWIKGYNLGKLLVLDKDNLDFANNPEDLGNIIQMVEREINGLF